MWITICLYKILISIRPTIFSDIEKRQMTDVSILNFVRRSVVSSHTSGTTVNNPFRIYTQGFAFRDIIIQSIQRTIKSDQPLRAICLHSPPFFVFSIMAIINYKNYSFWFLNLPSDLLCKTITVYVDRFIYFFRWTCLCRGAIDQNTPPCACVLVVPLMTFYISYWQVACIRLILHVDSLRDLLGLLRSIKKCLHSFIR